MDSNSDYRPMVSAIIPTNNRKKWVTEALESVFQQTYQDYEVIVVDDRSEDGTYEHLNRLFGSKIQLYRINGGTSSISRNFGASKARGKYLAFLDDDDRWYPGKLESQVAFMEAVPEDVAMVGSACDHMDEEGKTIWRPSYPDDELSYLIACIKPKLPGAISGCLIRKRVYDELGGMDTRYLRNEDREFWIRMTRKYKVLMMQDILSTVRLHTKVRRGVDTGVIEKCRREIDDKIPEPEIRRKAKGWTYFHLFDLNWRHNRLKALRFLFASFLVCPVPLPIKEHRGKMALRRLLGRG